MPVLNLTPSDIKRGKLVKPGWYEVLITKLEVKPSSKGDGSDVYWIHLTIQSGDYKDVPLIDFISEKAAGTAIPLLTACGAEINEETGASIDLDSIVGKKVMAKIEPGDVKGKTQNQVQDYRAAA